MEGIDELEAFLKSIDCPTRSSEVGIEEELFSQNAEDAMLVVRDGKDNPPDSPGPE